MVRSKGTRRVSRDEWQNNVLEIYEKIKSHKEPYEIRAGKLRLTVVPNVFSPKYFTDSLWFAEALAAIVGTKTLLEVGCGTGIVSLYCADGGATVVATDINPEACRNTEINAEQHRLRISVRRGDMFDGILEGEQFDFIFWNHPFNNWDRPVSEMLLRAGLDEGYRDLKRYIGGGKKYLKEGGSILLGTGDMADLESIRKIAENNGYRLVELDCAELPVEEGSGVMNSYIIELSPNT